MIIEYRGYQIKSHKDFPQHYIVAVAGKGGKIPNVLDSMFTTPAAAKDVIDRYLIDKKE